VTSVDWLDSLDADVRDQFLQIVAEVSDARNSESSEVNQSAKQAIIDAGGVVRQLTPAQRDKWVEKMKPVWEKFMGDIGQENIDAAVNSNTSS